MQTLTESAASQPKIQRMDITMNTAMDTPKATRPGQTPTARAITVQTEVACMVFMEDLKCGCSLTNAAERICRLVHNELLQNVPYPDIRWVYKDSDDELAEIITNGVSADFKSLSDNDLQVISAEKITRMFSLQPSSLAR